MMSDTTPTGRPRKTPRPCPPVDPVTGYLTLRQQCAEIKKFARKTGLVVIRVTCGRGTASSWRYIEVGVAPTYCQRDEIWRYATKNGLCGHHYPDFGPEGCSMPKIMFKKGSQLV
jgi:hypothetical protein